MPSEYSCAPKALPQLNFSLVNYRLGRYFSEFCIFIQPSSPQKKRCSQVQAFLSIHCAKAIAAKPVSAEQQAEIIASQRYYCINSGRTTKPGELEKPWF